MWLDVPFAEYLKISSARRPVIESDRKFMLSATGFLAENDINTGDIAGA